MEPSEGYMRARELRRHRFGNMGNEFRICEAWVSHITNGPMIKPNQSEALHDLNHVELTICEPV